MQIDSGVGKTADESMSAIKFNTTHKGYLANYSCIFKEDEAIGDRDE